MKKDTSIPAQIEPEKLADYLEVLTKAVFQAGVSWAMVDKKWDAFRHAFKEFDPEKIAAFKKADIARLMADPGILHSEMKIIGTIENARKMIALDRQHGGFQKYLRSHANYDALSNDLKKQFKFVGDLSVYYFLFRVREDVPPFDEWITTIPGEHPRMREMVEHARRK